MRSTIIKIKQAIIYLKPQTITLLLQMIRLGNKPQINLKEVKIMFSNPRTQTITPTPVANLKHYHLINSLKSLVKVFINNSKEKDSSDMV